MTGDFTSVPLRSTDRWTGARLQQGRVLLDGDWNLNVDATERGRQRMAQETIGPAGVLAGTSGFQISFDSSGTLMIGAGGMWVGGLWAVNAEAQKYVAQADITALPASGPALLYLDAFVQEVQPAEDPADLVDPAMDGVDTSARTRVAWRVRAVPTGASSCGGAATDLPALGLSTGTLNVVATTIPVSPDPCAPPDDPRGALPDGLLRVEVLDSGTESTARFAWSYENGSAAVAATVAGSVATLSLSSATSFATGERVEVSTLNRRADRADHGPLLAVDLVESGAAGQVITLSGPAPVSGTPVGLCLRRWDGETVGAAGQVVATLGGNDVGVAFSCSPGRYLSGDWWAARVRGSSTEALQPLTNAQPDGTLHHATALAVVDLDAATVLTDCRTPFVPLTQIKPGTCTVTALPGDDLQAAADRLPASGGELCLGAGVYAVDEPVTITGKQRIVVTGIGPATVVRAAARESVFQFLNCSDVTVRELRAESGTAPDAPEQAHILGALSFFGCTDVSVIECEASCPDRTVSEQSGVYVAPSTAVQGVTGQLPSRTRVLNSKLEIGDQQSGVVVISSDETTIEGNEIRLRPAPSKPIVTLPTGPKPVVNKPPIHVATELATFVGSHVLAETDTGSTGHTVKLPGGATMKIRGASQLQRLADHFGRVTTAGSLTKSTPRQQLQRFTRRALLSPETLKLSPSNTKFLLGVISSSRTLAQGIVIGGERADLVRVAGNLVSDVIQGIHVGLSGARGKTVNAGEIVIRDNVVASAVPFFWGRARHAYYIGSAQRVSLQDNSASLTRIGAALALLAAIRPTPVEAVRIHGRTGPWLSVRGMDLTGPFAAGVVITDLSPQTSAAKLQYVSDVLNASGTGPALTPQSIPHDRCVP